MLKKRFEKNNIPAQKDSSLLYILYKINLNENDLDNDYR